MDRFDLGGVKRPRAAERARPRPVQPEGRTGGDAVEGSLLQHETIAVDAGLDVRLWNSRGAIQECRIDVAFDLRSLRRVLARHRIEDALEQIAIRGLRTRVPQPLQEGIREQSETPPAFVIRLSGELVVA